MRVELSLEQEQSLLDWIEDNLAEQFISGCDSDGVVLRVTVSAVGAAVEAVWDGRLLDLGYAEIALKRGSWPRSLGLEPPLHRGTLNPACGDGR